MDKFSFKQLPSGCLVGKANLAEVKRYKSEIEYNNDRNLHLASSYWGSYGFVLKDVKRVKEVFCNGKLGFWDFDES